MPRKSICTSIPSPATIQKEYDDQAPGTSTEEEYLEDEAEEDELAAEQRRKDRQVDLKSSFGQSLNRHSFIFKVLRWPLLVFVIGVILWDLTCYVLVRQWVSWSEYFFTRGKKKTLIDSMKSATSYSLWKAAASELDSFLGLNEWKKELACSFYDYRLVHKIVRRLKRFREKKESVRDVCKILKHSGCKNNVGGVNSERIYSFTYFGTKNLVDDYVSETVQSLNFVARSEDMNLMEKQAFFRNLSKNYGRSALCLSGGGGLGYYHIGVAKALFENHLLPSVMTGASAGSLIAAMLCCRTNEEIKEEIFNLKVLQPRLTALADTTATRFKRFRETGAMFDIKDWLQKMQWMTKGNTTFLEAFLRTGRILNVSVVSNEPHAQPKLLNYITAPDVVIASAVIASSAIPGLLPPVQLLQKEESGELVPFRGVGKFWRDGSLQTDIPERELNQLFNVQYTIVSQMNPHIVLFFYNSRGSSGSPAHHRSGKGYRGGYIGSSLVQHFLLDLQKWLTLLRDIDLLPRFGADFSNVWLQRFEGNVTILPPALSFWDFRTILSDPSLERLTYQVDMGQLQTWPKLRIIENRMRIEQALFYWRHYLDSLWKEDDYSSGLESMPSKTQLSPTSPHLSD